VDAGLLRRVLSDQVERRHRGDVPVIVAIPGWSITVDGFDRHLERVHESLLTIADGCLGTRGSPIVADAATTPAVFMAGCYDGAGPETELARLPLWSRLAGAEDLRPRRRTIDLHTGVLYEEGPLTSLRSSSLARPGTVAMRACGDQTLLAPGGATRVRGNVAMALRDSRLGAGAVRFETRLGRTEDFVPLAAREFGCDLVVLGWSQELAPGRARVVRVTLERSSVPVMLVPVPSRAEAATSWR
jgi:hypothetical protein